MWERGPHAGPCQSREPAESLGTPNPGVPPTPVSPPQMTNPAIQNDFSYYRRTISRNRINNLQVRGLCRAPVAFPRGSQGWEWFGGGSGIPVTPIQPPQLDAESEVNNEMANRMSLFYAEATPMLKTLSNATTKFVSEVREAGGDPQGGQKPPPATTREAGGGNSSWDLLGFRTRPSLSRTPPTA